MLAYTPLSTTIFPLSAGIYRMKLKAETRLTTRNADTMSASSEPNLSYSTATNQVYKDLQNIDSLREDLITYHLEDQLQQSVKKIKRIMRKTLSKPAHVEELIMIDTIQRLGLEFYFRDDIHAALQNHYERHSSMEAVEGLHDAALRFRLLRQQGYNVPEDAFSNFTESEGKFKEDIRKDIKGLMSLYEASHLRIPGDHILEDAGEFSGKILQGLKNVEQSKTGIIRNTLYNPCHKSLPRSVEIFLMNFETSLQFLHDFSGNSKWIREVQYIARINIYMAHTNHQNETTQVSTWWKGLRLTEELKLARNRPEIWHMWSLACLPGPDMAEQRIELTKAISFVYIIDDIFDVYGTPEELTLFTEAVNRREYDNFKGLPNYMINCLKKLRELTNEMSKKTCDKHGWNPNELLHKAWAELCNSFLVEAKWFASGYTPSTGEYMKNGRISSAAGIIFAYVFLLLGEGGNNRRTDLLNNHPDIVSLVATILRLSDDLRSGKDENQNGNDGSYIDCYMNEHKGASAETAMEHVHTMISDAWKCINETCMSSPFSADFKAAALNLARMVPVMHSNEDIHRLPTLEKQMNSSSNIEQTTYIY